MQLPKSHTPHKVTKKNRFQKKVNKTTSQQVNKTTSQRVNEKSNYQDFEISRFRDFERAEAIVLTP